MFDINMYTLSDLRNKVPVIGESEWCLMEQNIIILSILFPLAQWATIDMHSNSPSKFQITTGEWGPLNAHHGAKCQDTFYTPHPQSAVNINPSQHYTRVEVSLIETPFPYLSNPSLHITCFTQHPNFPHPFPSSSPQYKWFAV